MAKRSHDLMIPQVMVATPGGPRGQGGIDRIMNSLAEALALQGASAAHVRFIATRGNGPIALSPFYVVAFILQMTGARLLGRVDVVHVNLASDGSTFRKLFICSFARLLGIPYIIHLHGAEYMRFWSDGDSFLHRRIGQMFKHAARIIVLGTPWRTFVLGKASVPEDRVVIIPNATAVPLAQHVGGGDSVHILFLGRIGERKGVPQLFDALAGMKEMPGWRATIAGDGDVDWLRARLANAGLEGRVTVPGWQGPDAVAALLSHADILVLPSFAENLPVSVIEGMAEGLAIVTTPVGAIEDIIEDNRTGILVPPGDAVKLKAALERLVLDRDLRKRLGNAARDVHRQRLDLPHFARAISAVWKDAANDQHHRKERP